MLQLVEDMMPSISLEIVRDHTAILRGWVELYCSVEPVGLIVQRDNNNNGG